MPARRRVTAAHRRPDRVWKRAVMGHLAERAVIQVVRQMWGLGWKQIRRQKRQTVRISRLPQKM